MLFRSEGDEMIAKSFVEQKEYKTLDRDAGRQFAEQIILPALAAEQTHVRKEVAHIRLKRRDDPPEVIFEQVYGMVGEFGPCVRQGTGPLLMVFHHLPSIAKMGLLCRFCILVDYGHGTHDEPHSGVPLLDTPAALFY